MVKIVTLENEINEDIDRLVEISREVMVAVNTVTEPQENLVLSRRYLNFWTWEDIAAEMDCSVRHIHRLHGKALEEVKIF